VVSEHAASYSPTGHGSSIACAQSSPPSRAHIVLAIRQLRAPATLAVASGTSLTWLAPSPGVVYSVLVLCELAPAVVR